MYRLGLIVEYSRMQVPSLSSGCEIAQLFVRHMVDNTKSMDLGVSMARDPHVATCSTSSFINKFYVNGIVLIQRVWRSNRGGIKGVGDENDTGSASPTEAGNGR